MGRMCNMLDSENCIRNGMAEAKRSGRLLINVFPHWNNIEALKSSWTFNKFASKG